MLAVQRTLGVPVYELREWEISQRRDVRELPELVRDVL